MRATKARLKRPQDAYRGVGQLYVIRHGQTTCNAAAIIQGPRIDSELSEEGQRQAAALGSAFQESNLDAIVTSPMQRARHTAEALVAGTGATVASRVAPELYEIDFGDYCGHPMPDVADGVAQVVDAWDMGFVDQAFPGGESPVLAQHRIRHVADHIRQEAQSHDVAVVAHGRINRILLATLMGLPLTHMKRFPQDNASITQLAWTEAGVQVRRLNDISHLT